jgi:ribosomal-protein-alanine N-acetyltransferase
VSLAFDLMDEASARVALGWRYDPPYELYNTDAAALDDDVLALLNPDYAYYRITNRDGELVAYCCFGPDAQVEGGDYTPDALDIGLGVRPDLTGQGHGLEYAQAVLDFARQTFAPATFRVTIAEFNRRALRVWEKAGFRVVQRYLRDPDGMPFVVLKRSSR